MPDHLTEAQLEFFSEQTRRAVHKAVGKYIRGALVGFFVLLLGVGFAIHATDKGNVDSRHAIVQSGRAVAVDSCNGRFIDREKLRGLLLASEATIPESIKRGDISPAQAEFARKFYARQLAELRLPDCRVALKIITDDPGRTVKIPKPLHAPETPRQLRDSIFQG